jgi:hypothetical protein
VAPQFTILDERGNWHGPAIETAVRRGYDAKRITRGGQARGRSGLGFIRPHAIPAILDRNHLDWVQMAEHLTMVQDYAQVEVYDDKSAQFFRWAKWMPQTWRFEKLDNALQFARHFPIEGRWIVSKADVGASSKNVRILRTRRELIEHCRQIFGRGIEVDHCAGGRAGEQAKSRQRGYVLLQEYVQHDITWRVNIIGRGRAIFKRYNAPGTHVAQTGNVDGVTALDETTTSLLDFADEVFEAIGTRWCALDILRYGGSWKLLETSLGWPWPSPGNCMEAQFFGPTTRKWAELWDLMFDEYEAGTWTDARAESPTTFA